MKLRMSKLLISLVLGLSGCIYGGDPQGGDTQEEVLGFGFTRSRNQILAPVIVNTLNIAS